MRERKGGRGKRGRRGKSDEREKEKLRGGEIKRREERRVYKVLHVTGTYLVANNVILQLDLLIQLILLNSKIFNSFISL